LTAAGSATTVVVDANLAIYATPDVGLNPSLYALDISLDAETYATIAPVGDISSVYFDGTKFVLALTGVSAGTVVITAELKQVTYPLGVRTLTSFDTPITDTLSIEVTAA
jgi:hypothetical protein